MAPPGYITMVGCTSTNDARRIGTGNRQQGRINYELSVDRPVDVHLYSEICLSVYGKIDLEIGQM